MVFCLSRWRFRRVEPRWGWRAADCAAVQQHSPGSRSAPPVFTRNPHTNPEGVVHDAMLNPVGVRAVWVTLFPGCAARPWALLLNPVGVSGLRYFIRRNHGKHRPIVGLL
jgi:hypothetical protein